MKPSAHVLVHEELSQVVPGQPVPQARQFLGSNARFWALRLTTDPAAPDAAALEAADGDVPGDAAAEALGPADPAADGAALEGGDGANVQPGEAVFTHAAAMTATIAARMGTAAMRIGRIERGGRIRADLTRKVSRSRSAPESTWMVGMSVELYRRATQRVGRGNAGRSGLRSAPRGGLVPH